MGYYEEQEAYRLKRELEKQQAKAADLKQYYKANLDEFISDILDRLIAIEDKVKERP